MTGGRRPPGPTPPPQPWLDTLPIITAVGQYTGYSIFQGTAQTITNLIVDITTEGYVRALRVDATHYLYYDEDADEIRTEVYVQSGLAQSVVEQAGIEGLQAVAAENVENITKDDIHFKLVPSS